MSQVQAPPVHFAGDREIPPIRLSSLIWCALAIGLMVAAIASRQLWYLNFVHVMAGVLWTGIDLFMGFVIGPVMRMLPMSARRALICRLMPRMLFLMPTLAIITGTAGWYYAAAIGYLDMPWPQYGWVLAALIVIVLLTIQGTLILLPTNLLVYLELRKPEPNGARIGRLMRYYVYCTAFQGAMQVGIIVIMAKFVTGL
jgi:uncharacterized membrane protein